MSRFFLGQNLSSRWFEHASPDPLRLRIWVALRYLTIVACVFLAPLLFGRSPGGGLLTGAGAGMAMSGLLNVVFLPRGDRSPARDLLLLVGGGIALAAGIFLVTSS